MTATLDPVNTGSNIILSGGNLIATKTIDGASVWEVSRATASVSTGKYYFEFSQTTMPTPGLSGVGFVNSSFVLNSFGGGSVNGINWINDGRIFYNNTVITTINGCNPNDIMAVAFDVGAQLLWIKNVTQASFWNNSAPANPATGTGGISVSVAGALFPAVMLHTNDAGSVNFGATSFAGSMPSGFSLLPSGSASNTTIYIVGNGTGAITPRSTATWTVECWGAGQAGDSSANAGNGAGWAQLNSFSAVAGTPVAFSLGSPGLTGGTPGGDTWFSAAGTVIAPGGGSTTSAIGNSTATGGLGSLAAANPGGAAGGGGGAGGPGGNGQPGGNSLASTAGGGGGGGNGGGTAGSNTSLLNGQLGGAGGQGVLPSAGGAGGTPTVPNGGNGGAGAGGGGGASDDATYFGTGGNGGDDYDNGGGGGASGGQGFAGDNFLGTPGKGGTPGGGGGPNAGTGLGAQGGWALIKITYSSSDSNQIMVVGSIGTVQIPASWMSTCLAEAWGGGGNGVAGTASRGGAGGGSSGYSKVNALAVTPGGTLTVAVGGQGVASTIGASLVAHAGSNGATTTGGVGGTAGTGNTTTAGVAGGAGSATASAGGAGGAGAPGATGVGVAGSASNTGGTGHGGGGGSANGATQTGGAGGVNNGTSTTGPGAAGKSDSRGGSGGGGGGHSTTAANAAGGAGAFPGGGGGGGGAGAASSAGLGAIGLIILTRATTALYTQAVVLSLSQLSQTAHIQNLVRRVSLAESVKAIKRISKTITTSPYSADPFSSDFSQDFGPVASGGLQVLATVAIKIIDQQTAAALSAEVVVARRRVLRTAAEVLQQAVAYTRRVLPIIAVSLGQTLSTTKAFTKTVIAIPLAHQIVVVAFRTRTSLLQAQTVLAIYRVAKKFTIFTSSIITASENQQTHQFSFAFIQNSIHAFIKQVDFIIALSDVWSSAFSSSFGGAYNPTFQTLSTISLPTRIIAFIQTEIIAVIRRITYPFAFVNNQVFIAIKAIRRTATAILSPQTFIGTGLKLHTQPVAVTLNEIVALSKQTLRVVKLLQTQVVALSRRTLHSVAIAQSYVLGAVKRMTHSVAMSLAYSLQTVKTLRRLTALISAYVITLVRQPLKAVNLLSPQVFQHGGGQQVQTIIFVLSETATAIKRVSRQTNMSLTALLAIIRTAAHRTTAQSSQTFAAFVQAIRSPALQLTQTVKAGRLNSARVLLSLTPVFNAVKAITKTTIAVPVTVLLGPIGRITPGGRVVLNGLNQIVSFVYRLFFNRTVQGADLPPFDRGAVLPPPTGLPPEM